MSLSTACSHPWLVGASQYQHRSITADDSIVSLPDGASSISLLHSMESEDDAMIAEGSGQPEVTSSLEKLHLRQNSRAPLQAAENDVALSDPSWQMVHHAQENGNGARHGKRKLDPHSNPAVDADVENGNLKKPRRVPEANSPCTMAQGREGSGSPIARLQEAAMGMVVEVEHMEQDPDGEEAPAASPPPRRKSARVPAQKGVRRG